jgi:hypothetical protein
VDCRVVEEEEKGSSRREGITLKAQVVCRSRKKAWHFITRRKMMAVIRNELMTGF